jgi:uncharacterized surface protein with fasciclin (FAS1) repeats
VRHRTPNRALLVGALALTVGLTSFVGVASAEGSSSKQKAPKTVVALAKSSEDFSTLVKAVGAAGLVKTLKSKGPFTVFAPTNEAFAKVPAADLEALLDDPEALAEVLTYHVIDGRIHARDLKPTQTVQTVQGEDLTIDVADDGTATITDAAGHTVTITKTGLKAKNGIVHVIDGVLTPTP